MTDLNDAAFKAQRIRISKLVRRWKNTLGLNAWHINHTFFRGAIPNVDSEGSGWSAAAAKAWPDYRYLHAKVHWSMDAVSEQDDDDLQRIVIHEMAHCLTDCFKRYALRELGAETMGVAEMERQVSEIEQAITWAYEEGLKDGRKPMPGKKHLPGATPKMNRQYEAIKESALKAGKPLAEAKSIAAATVNAGRKKK